MGYNLNKSGPICSISLYPTHKKGGGGGEECSFSEKWGGRERGLTSINTAFCQFFVINTLPVSITAAEEGVGEEKKK